MIISHTSLSSNLIAPWFTACFLLQLFGSIFVSLIFYIVTTVINTYFNLIIKKPSLLFIGVYQSVAIRTGFQNTASHIISPVKAVYCGSTPLHDRVFLHNVWFCYPSYQIVSLCSFIISSRRTESHYNYSFIHSCLYPT